LSTLSSLGVKITVFTVGEIFELFPDVIKLFGKYNAEFQPHSYTHNFDKPDSEYEIKMAKKAYITYFQKAPEGYRAPRGKISDSGIKLLEEQGFLYDSSIIPSYFPDPIKYLFSKKEVHYYNNSKVMEIPFTSLSPFRITLSVSYIKLLGVNFYKKLSLPNVVCFGAHIHDFIINDDSFDKLPFLWRMIYSRNKHHGTALCMDYLKYVRLKGYEFCYMSDLYNLHKK